MSIVVTKCSAEVVGPSEPGTPTGDIQLSRFDMVAGPAAVPLVLVFEKPIADPVETIRRALSRALVHYYPVCGRLAAGPEVIRCSGDGVLFVAASASCAVGDHGNVVNDLFVHYSMELLCGHADPLLLMQVTEFSCGGFAMGVTWNHVLTDGVGIGQFLQAVGELACGMSLSSMVPDRSDESVLAANPPVGPFGMDFPSEEHVKDMAFVDYAIRYST